MNKYLLLLAFFLILIYPHSASAQGGPLLAASSPTHLVLDLETDGTIADTGLAMGDVRLRSNFLLNDRVSFGGLVKSRVDPGARWTSFGSRSTRLVQLYVQHSDSIQIIGTTPRWTARAGRLESYPTFNDPTLVLEHIDRYTNPPVYHGASLSLVVPISDRFRVALFADAISGDLINRHLKPALNELVISGRPQLIDDLSLDAQFGQSQSSRHLVNHAFLKYTPTLFDYLHLDARAGKLIGVDEQPYGLHLGLFRKFKYLEIGGYIERRLGQAADKQYIGLYWNVIGPPLLARVFGTYRLIFDTNTNTLRFTVPVVSLGITW